MKPGGRRDGMMRSAAGSEIGVSLVRESPFLSWIRDV